MVSQLPDSFKGHALTGWAPGKHGIGRMTADLQSYQIEFNVKKQGFQSYSYMNGWKLKAQPLEQALKEANEYALTRGGWAPAPIGSDPGWRYDVEAVPDYQTVQVSYHFGEGDPTPPMVYRKAQRNKAGVWKFYDGHGWELLHGIVYAWREEPGVDPAPPEAKP